MEVLNLSTRVPQAFPIVLHFVKLLHNTNFTFSHLDSSLPKSSNILSSLLGYLHLFSFGTGQQGVIFELQVGEKHLHQVKIDFLESSSNVFKF